MAQAHFKPVEEQLAYLKKGVAEIIREDELLARLEKSRKTGKPLRVYLGVDPTAPDIHLGHTVVLRKLKHFQDLGHTAIFLIGDFSAMIGDPTGQSETRPPLSRKDVDANAKTYLEQVFKILDRKKTEVRYNSEWLDKLSSYDIVRLCAKYQLSRLLEREDFRKRLESGQEWELRRRRREALRPLTPEERAQIGRSVPDMETRAKLTPVQAGIPAPNMVARANLTPAPQPISVHELLYPLLTAYDAVSLRSDVELGATEQKFNLLVHREIQREYGLQPQICMTMPILVGLDGQRKMSKSLNNYVGITEPPQEMFGKLMRIPDDLMWSYWELLTDRSDAEIQGMRRSLLAPTRQVSENSRAHLAPIPNPMDIKLTLAGEVVGTFHGDKAAREAADYFRRVVRERLVPNEMSEFRLKRAVGATFFAFERRGNIEEAKPPVTFSRADGEKWSKVLVLLGQAVSTSEVERLMKQGALEINEMLLKDPASRLELNKPNTFTIRLGKRKFLRLIVG